MKDQIPDVLTVIHRALALQHIIDRGWAEHHLVHAQDKDGNAKKARELVLKWNEEEGISEWLTDKEKTIWGKQIGELGQEEIAFCTWRLESLVPLLWALGLIDTMPGFSIFVDDSYYPMLHYCKEKPVEHILADIRSGASDLLFRKPEEVELQADLYMLVNWRCIGYLLHKNNKMDMTKTPKEVFGEGITKAVSMLRLTKKGELVVEGYGVPFSDMRKHNIHVLQMLVERRQHALNWLMGQDENWDDISTDT